MYGNNDVNKCNYIFENNCFDLIKLIAAVIVVLSHTFRHFNFEKPMWLLFLTNGSIGTIAFFSISGYLVSASYERHISKSKGNLQFIIRRVVRIYPAVILNFIIISLMNCAVGVNILKLDYLKYFLMNWLIPAGGGTVMAFLMECSGHFDVS